MHTANRTKTLSRTMLPFFSSACFALGSLAMLSSTPALAQAAASAPEVASATASTTHMRSHAPMHRSAASHQDFVEKRLNAMHADLGITAAQSSQWDAFAQTMRDSAANTDAAYKSRADKLATLNADDAMKSYADLAQMHADNTQKLATAFSALYATFSAEQKQNADVMFRNQRAHRQAMKRPHKRMPAASTSPTASAAAAPSPASN